MKDISTLVEDIYAVVDQKGGWDATVSAFYADLAKQTVERRLSPDDEEYTPSLRMSNMGRPCKRQLWYSIHETEKGEELRADTKLKFLFGDILEDLLISLAMAAGHTVTGTQDTMEIEGIKGHRDCVIDGVTVDIKSASTFSFKKFKENKLREDDPFGYISQLSSYVYAAKDDPLVTDKTHGAFLVIDKQHGKICLDMYDLTKEVAEKKEDVLKVKKIVDQTVVPPRGFRDETEGKSGNRKLGLNCRYCAFKEHCWPGLRTFMGYKGPVFLTKVEREPRMEEITDG